MQAKADITGRSWLISSLTQATAAGAAMLAAGFPAQEKRKGTPVSADGSLREAYEEKYRTYRQQIAEWR